MDDIPLNSLVLLGALILLSAFFSSAETAYSSVNKIRLMNFVSEGRRGSTKAHYIAENFDKALSTILVGNNIVNIAAASISAKLATDIFGGNTGLVISTFVMTLLILIFGEILPKSLAKENAETYSLTISGVLYFLIKILTPINFFFIKLKELVSKFFSKNHEMPSVTEEELKVMLDISEEEGVIDKEERELIHRSMDFDDILVTEVLTPRIDVKAVEVNQPIEEIKEMFFEERFSRIPVYEDHIDNVIGILSEKEFFTHLIKFGEVNVRELIREPMFIFESAKISSLLTKLQKNNVHMAIVVDEFGGTTGIITLEDILEEIVGEIWDEQDEKTHSMRKINEKEYTFDSQYQLDEFTELLDVPEPESSYHTVGGWVVESFEDLPSEGDSFDYENLKVSVEEVDNRRVRTIKVEILEKKTEDIVQ
ncbi:hemolysin family protein (plasmid) [Cytobacillus spongiae]|uniref:hemolysin family protein n=1 Tax=Cytobacillus spongiae TaxID=2901381 RepID=UPI00145E85F7|nr:hemolysin family protein [Cytobacillus spongiae]MCA1062683.1 hemolysin family protein [Rossellomorea aquimaris]NMH70022.1 HlyC/CorC family transporter [Bacillus sp. RO3]UII58310.1 hemolysin family protein [Cytobacillus spongiae]WJV28651.1 hemolysin family protein [Rossellomorea sp. AcN35-11]